MAQFVNATNQTVAVNQNVLFTEANPLCGCSNSILHRNGSGIITLVSRGGCPCQGYAKYRISFGANLAVAANETAGPISLAIAINGEPDQTSIMTITPAAASTFNNVSRVISIPVPLGVGTTISIKNISTIPVEVSNVTLLIERWA